jgi:titin
VQGNFIGTNATGVRILGNSGDGVFINGAPGNTVGGTTTGARNVISGNTAHGILILGSSATGNQVQGNYIGTNVAGTLSLYNGIGVFINDAPGNTIGGMTTGARNVISGNGEGVRIAGNEASGNQVQGNYIGTNAAGTSAVGNTQDGVVINGAPGNTIGGAVGGARNVISGNKARGVFIVGSGATGNLVQGNHIGTNAAGMAAVGNVFHGVFINDVPGNQVAENVISGNGLVGVLILGSGATRNQVVGNLIGTNVVGTAALGNAVGVFVGESASGNTVGEGNVIAFNRGDGVYVNSGTGNAVVSNSIFANADLGINLAPGGSTPNDDTVGDEDADIGANKLQNSPRLSQAALSGGTLAVRYAISSQTRHSAYPIRIEIFKADAGGQGHTFLGSDTYTAADRTGTFTKSVTLALWEPLRSGDHLVATATDKDGNTSEFSFMIAVSAAQP